MGEIIFYILIGIANLIIATEWAKYGILEIGIQRPLNGKAIFGTFLGVCTVFTGGIISRVADFNPVNYYAIGFVIGVPLLWVFIYRHLLLAPGLFDFNRAKIRTNYWRLTSLQNGEILSERGAELRSYFLAKNTIKIFQRAIEAQKKGSSVREVTKQIDLSDENLVGYGGGISANCPVCGTHLTVPVDIDGGVEGGCNFCGAMLTARTIRGTLYLSAFLLKPIRVVSDKHEENIAVAYSELAVLYRMMNLFKEARDSLEEGSKITGELLKKNPNSESYLALKSMILFRVAELDHAQGNADRARENYRLSLDIDRKLNDEEGIRTNEEMLQKLGV